MMLPYDMFKQELLQYLTVHDIVKLDNACMNFKSRQTAGKYYVANGEPLMDRYLQRIDVAAVNPDEINHHPVVVGGLYPLHQPSDSAGLEPMHHYGEVGQVPHLFPS